MYRRKPKTNLHFLRWTINSIQLCFQLCCVDRCNNWLHHVNWQNVVNEWSATGRYHIVVTRRYDIEYQRLWLCLKSLSISYYYSYDYDLFWKKENIIWDVFSFRLYLLLQFSSTYTSFLRDMVDMKLIQLSSDPFRCGLDLLFWKSISTQPDQ